MAQVSVRRAPGGTAQPPPAPISRTMRTCAALIRAPGERVEPHPSHLRASRQWRGPASGGGFRPVPSGAVIGAADRTDILQDRLSRDGAALGVASASAKIEQPAWLRVASAMGDCEQDDSDDSDGAAYFHRMRPLSGATLVPEIDKQIVYARAEIMNYVQEFVVNEGMSSKRGNTYLNFSSGNRDMKKSFKVLDKNYCYIHRFELHCGINWREIWRIFWIEKPFMKESMFKDMALIGLISTSEDEFFDIQYRSMRDVDRTSNL
ncbi:hypothetical protein [Ancylobacter sp.]|uniref:hypothetical protein n=1 Tax=Ancylobacter sp. TaxID=1872567 RepID=UPI003BA9A4DB